MGKTRNHHFPLITSIFFSIDTIPFESGNNTSVGIHEKYYPTDAGIAVSLLLVLLLTYISSVMEFVFVESLVRNEVKFGDYSRRFLGKGFYLLLVSLALTMVFFTLLNAVMPYFENSVGTYGNYSSVRSDPHEVISWYFAVIIFFFAFIIVEFLLSDAISSLLRLAIPLSIYRNIGILSAFLMVCRNFRKSWHEFVVYWVIRPLLFIGAIVLFMIAVSVLVSILCFIFLCLLLLFPSLQSYPLILILLIPFVLIVLALLFSVLLFVFAFGVFLEYHLLSFLEAWFEDTDIPFFDDSVLEPEKGFDQS